VETKGASWSPIPIQIAPAGMLAGRNHSSKTDYNKAGNHKSATSGTVRPPEVA
jgi:hypothetical protein